MAAQRRRVIAARPFAAVLLAWALMDPAIAAAQGWAAFIAPDLAQTRLLHEDLKRRAEPELQSHKMELRYVPVPQADDAAMRARIAEVVAGEPKVIIAVSTVIAAMAKSRTATIPIIFASVADPVRAGLVASLAQPGANLTGFTYDIPVEGKQLELLAEIAPRAKVFGVLEDGHWLGERITQEQLSKYEAALGRRIQVFHASSPGHIPTVVSGSDARNVDAWLVPIGNYAAEARKDLVAALRKAKRPAVFGRTFFVEAGGLASFQEVIADPVGIWLTMFQQVLKGVPPSKIPVQRPKQFEMALNLEEAERLGMPFSPSLVRRANRTFPK